MDTFCKAVIFLSAFITAAQCLTCHQCSIGVFDSCIFGKEVTCSNGTESCFRGKANFNDSDTFNLHIRGCLDSDLCGKTITGVIVNIAYTSSFECCTTDLCNGATFVQLPLAGALCVAILSCFWSI